MRAPRAREKEKRMATILEMPNRYPSPASPRPKPREVIISAEEYLIGDIAIRRSSEFEQFVSNLDTARQVYRRFPEFVSSESVDVPEYLLRAFRDANQCEPFTVGVAGLDVFEPDFENRIVQEAIDDMVERYGKEDPEAMREQLEDLLPVLGPVRLPPAA
jgi:hypothetical protein